MKKIIGLIFCLYISMNVFAQDFRGLSWGCSTYSLRATECELIEETTVDNVTMYKYRRDMSGKERDLFYLFTEDYGLFSGVWIVEYKEMPVFFNYFKKKFGEPVVSESHYAHWIINDGKTILAMILSEDDLNKITFMSKDFVDKKELAKQTEGVSDEGLY